MMPVAIGALGRYNKRKKGQVQAQRKHPSYYHSIYEAIRNKENHHIDPNYIKIAMNEQRAKDQSYNEKLEKFGEIKVSTNKNSYQAGDSVKGVVSFKLKQQILAKQLMLKVKGYQFVQLNNEEINKKILKNLKNNQIQNSDDSISSYIETFVIYDHKFVIYEEEENQLFLQNQNYVIPFEIKLEDKNLPRSFQIIEKDVQLVTIYKISAIIPIDPSTATSDMQDSQNNKNQLKFTEVLNMSEQPQMMKMKHLVSQFDSNFAGFSCCTKPQKSLKISIFLDKNQQIANHDVIGYYEIHVQDGGSVPPFKGLQFKLIRFLKIKFPEDGVDRKLKTDIQVYIQKIDQKSLKREVIKDNQCKFIGQFSIKLPSDMQPTITSTNVQLQYALVCRPIKFGLFGKCVPKKLVSEGKVLIYYMQDVNNDGDEVSQEQLIIKHCESNQSSPDKPGLNDSQKSNKQIQLKLLKLESGKLAHIQEMDEKDEIF